MGYTQTPQHFDLFTRVTEVVDFDHIPVITAAGISFLCGYIQYYFAVRLSMSDRKGPFPLWMHIFYFAHDTSWSYLLRKAAPDYGYHWFLTWSSWGITLWNVPEIICIYRAVFIEEEDISSDPLRRHSRRQSFWYIAMFTATMYGLISLGNAFMGPSRFFQWAAICNTIMVLGPTTTWLRRGSRNGLSISLALAVVVSTVCTFAPFGMWVQIAPEIFDHSAFYFLGVVLTVLSITNVVTVASYPPKVARKGQNSSVW